MQRITTSEVTEPERFDWRGWITLAWVLWCGWAYALMAFKARGPLVMSWLRASAHWIGWL
jgi:hypothetical protein